LPLRQAARVMPQACNSRDASLLWVRGCHYTTLVSKPQTSLRAGFRSRTEARHQPQGFRQPTGPAEHFRAIIGHLTLEVSDEPQKSSDRRPRHAHRGRPFPPGASGLPRQPGATDGRARGPGPRRRAAAGLGLPTVCRSRAGGSHRSMARHSGLRPPAGDGLLHLRLDLYYAPCLAGGQARRAHPRTGGELPFLRPGSRCGAGRRVPYPGLGGNRHSVHPSGTRSPAAVAPTDRCPGLLWVEWHLPSDLPPD
jgi:hypothetical protein